MRTSPPCLPIPAMRVGEGPRPAPGAAPDSGEGPSLFAEMATILTAGDIGLAWESVVRAFRRIGFVHVLYGYAPFSRRDGLGDPEDWLVLTTLAPELADELMTQRHYLDSITVNGALCRPGVLSWSARPEALGLAPDFGPSPEALAFYSRIGFNSGCTVGFPRSRTLGQGVMSLVAAPEVPQDEVDAWLPEAADAILVLATLAHRTLTALPWPRPRGDLTARQREVLEWVAEGKTTADIACILGLTPATVEKHLRLARLCLGVETTAHALVRATSLNQIFVEAKGPPRADPSRAPRLRGRQPRSGRE